MQIAFNMDDNGGRDKIRNNTSCRQPASGEPDGSAYSALAFSTLKCTSSSRTGNPVSQRRLSTSRVATYRWLDARGRVSRFTNVFNLVYLNFNVVARQIFSSQIFSSHLKNYQKNIAFRTMIDYPLSIVTNLVKRFQFFMAVLRAAEVMCPK